jgi:RNA polymerase sigma-70 factor (ECF subfamily)
MDYESQAWLAALRARGSEREAATARLHDLLLRAARFECSRRRDSLARVGAAELDDLAHQAADDALVAVLRKLDSFHGDSRFTTWAYKFALLEAGVKLRRRAWEGRELPLENEERVVDLRPSPQTGAEAGELLRSLSEAIRTELTPHQRKVLVAVAVNDVPIDVLADRMDTTRGALYKTLHDARQKLRAHLGAKGLRPNA